MLRYSLGRLLYILALARVADFCDHSKQPELPSATKDMMSRAIRLDGVPSDDVIENAVNCQRVKRLVNESAFSYMFPMANEGKGMGNGPYTYDGFLKAVAKWPKFCDDAAPGMDKDEVCLRELSTLFAHIGQEVGAHIPSSDIPEWRQGLYYYREIHPWSNYCATSPSWVTYRFPCQPGQSYFGRGAKQVSYNYNYGPFSYAIYGDPLVLLKNPDGVITNEGGWLAFASAIWFDLTPQTPKPSIHDVVSGWWKPNDADKKAGRLPGFGATILITNGGLECGHASQQADNRVKYYEGFCQYLNISPGDALTCQNMRTFDALSSSASPEYWDYADWLNNCRLVPYQSAFSVFDDPRNASKSYCGCMDMHSRPKTQQV